MTSHVDATTHLLACPGCARHVRASEASCPFCSAELPASLRAVPPRRGPAARLGRAGVAAFGVGSLVVPLAMEACSTEQTSSFYGSVALLDADLERADAEDAHAAPLAEDAGHAKEDAGHVTHDGAEGD